MSLRRPSRTFEPQHPNSDDLAETAQRQALALRCQAWEGVPKTGSSDSARALIAKKAAVPCLRNLASFVSNQGRHVDAEVVLVSCFFPVLFRHLYVFLFCLW